MDGVLKVINMLGNTIGKLEEQVRYQEQRIQALQEHQCEDCAEKKAGEVA